MPIKYSLLKGQPIDRQLATSQTKHYQILIAAKKTLHRIAVNVQSVDSSEVEYLVYSDFQHPIINKLSPLKVGLHSIKSRPGGLALDYIRGNLAQSEDFTPLPLSETGPDNDLNEKLDCFIQRAIADENAIIYAFGSAWGPEWDEADQYFGFLPGRGIHNIHMNQGNPPGQFEDENGPWQDGGLLFHFLRQQEWGALFLKFQTQKWEKDDETGNLKTI